MPGRLPAQVPRPRSSVPSSRPDYARAEAGRGSPISWSERDLGAHAVTIRARPRSSGVIRPLTNRRLGERWDWYAEPIAPAPSTSAGVHLQRAVPTRTVPTPSRFEIVLDGVLRQRHLPGHGPGVAAGGDQAKQLVFARAESEGPAKELVPLRGRLLDREHESLRPFARINSRSTGRHGTSASGATPTDLTGSVGSSTYASKSMTSRTAGQAGPGRLRGGAPGRLGG
jgi:hypothetical protein